LYGYITMQVNKTLNLAMRSLTLSRSLLVSCNRVVWRKSLPHSVPLKWWNFSTKVYGVILQYTAMLLQIPTMSPALLGP